MKPLLPEAERVRLGRLARVRELAEARIVEYAARRARDEVARRERTLARWWLRFVAGFVVVVALGWLFSTPRDAWLAGGVAVFFVTRAAIQHRRTFGRWPWLAWRDRP